MARLDLVLDSNGRIKSFGQEVFKLPKSVPDADYLASWYEEYNSRVKQEYEKSVAMKKKMSTGESPYGGEAVCKTCHANAYQAWQQSKHARAFEQLEGRIVACAEHVPVQDAVVGPEILVGPHNQPGIPSVLVFAIPTPRDLRSRVNRGREAT